MIDEQKTYQNGYHQGRRDALVYKAEKLMPPIPHDPTLTEEGQTFLRGWREGFNSIVKAHTAPTITAPTSAKEHNS